MEFIDTHCHVQSVDTHNGERTTSEKWQKANLSSNAIIKNALGADVKRIVCVGCDLNDSQLAVNFASFRENCYASIGIHPHEAKDYTNDSKKLAEFSSLVGQPKVIAIGECGLDYLYNLSPRNDQIKILNFQLDLASRVGLPMIFHVREAFDDFWPIFEKYKDIRGVLHSFTDNEENLKRAISRGLFIGVNGIATFAKPEQLETYKKIPLENLLLETDSPFLTPTPYRNEVNEPKYIRTIAEFLSKLRTEPLEVIADATTKNAMRLFNI